MLAFVNERKKRYRESLKKSLRYTHHVHNRRSKHDTIL
jgi:hypothetical protein